MGRDTRAIIGIATAFFIIQSCGEAFTGQISPGPSSRSEATGGAQAPRATGGGAQARGGAGGGGTLEPVEPDAGGGGEVAVDAGEPFDAGVTVWSFDDGGDFWDGGAPVVLLSWHWKAGLTPYRGQNGQRFTVSCVPDGSELAVWGADPYSDDSPVCTAGLHQGVISRDGGGPVTVEVRPGQLRFEGQSQNGVPSYAWGPYPGSYRVIAP